ncbi:MAG: tRNA (N(6)-L-threonylcarbamoyladenosine(37)-C(2))-methylthiotransferase MtaB [Mycoplasmoidaceae bacterium]
MKTFFTINLGCKVNLFETNALTYQLVQKGFKEVNDINKANIVLINTCSVTNKADAKSRNMINRAKQAKLKPVVIVMGCFSQVNKEWFRGNKADIVIGTKHRNKVIDYLNKYLKDKKPIIKIEKDLNSFEELVCPQHLNNTRAFLKIQDGCNFFCSYCLIPYCRGRQCAMKHQHVLQTINNYVKHGYEEIVLTGVNTAGYKDGNYSFYDLLKDINELPGNFRVRISSLEPFQITRPIIDLLASNKNRWANQIHLCLQSANNQVLKDMNRKYTIQEFITLVKYIRKQMPNVSITTDYIVGYSSETDKMFADSIKNLNKIKFANMNIFIYSRRHGTTADKKYKTDVNPIVARKRYNIVEQLKNKHQKQYLQTLIGKTLDVIVERSTLPLMHGYSSEFVKVVFPSKTNLQGHLVKTKITKIGLDNQGYYLIGRKK